MKIKVLVDNISNDSYFKKEWGLSILVKFYNKDILLDFGQSDKFIKNSERLDCDLREVDYAVLSHAHYDHANGMNHFFDLNCKAQCYMRDESRNLAYSNHSFLGIKHKHYIGIKKGLLNKYQSRITYINGDSKTELAKNVYLVPHNYTSKKIDEKFITKGMFQKTLNEETNKFNKEFIADNFNHEMSLVFDTKDGLVIFNSCSHYGVKNIINEVKKEFDGKNVYGYIGGLHLFKATKEEVNEACEVLVKENVEYIVTGHCTGEKNFETLYQALGEKLTFMESGLEIEI